MPKRLDDGLVYGVDSADYEPAGVERVYDVPELKYSDRTLTLLRRCRRVTATAVVLGVLVALAVTCAIFLRARSQSSNPPPTTASVAPILVGDGPYLLRLADNITDGHRNGSTDLQQDLQQAVAYVNSTATQLLWLGDADPLLDSRCVAPWSMHNRITLSMTYEPSSLCYAAFHADGQPVLDVNNIPCYPCLQDGHPCEFTGGEDHNQCVRLLDGKPMCIDGPSIPWSVPQLKSFTYFPQLILNVLSLWSTHLAEQSYKDLAAALAHYRDLFWDAGINHDLCYHHEPEVHGWNKQQCDALFLKDTRDICRASADRGRLVKMTMDVLWIIPVSANIDYTCGAWAEAFWRILQVVPLTEPAWRFSAVYAPWARIDTYQSYVDKHGPPPQPMAAPAASDLVGIDMHGNGQHLERHALSGPNHYQIFSEHLSTGFYNPADGLATFPFWFISENNDLLFIARDRGQGSWELHALTAVSGWSSFSVHTKLPIAATADCDVGYAKRGVLQTTTYHDLLVVQKTGTASGQHEFFVLRAADQWLKASGRVVLPTPTA
jgi:hypothetical protein